MPRNLSLSMGLSASAGRPFNPIQRGPQLALWLQGSTITQSGGNVSTWPDSSGNWSAATPGSTAPVYTASNAAYNHLPTATFGGIAGQQLNLASFAVSQPDTIYVVGSNSAGSTNTLDGNTNRQIVGFTTAWYCYAGSFLTSAITTAGPHVIAAEFNGAFSAMYIDNSGSAAVSGNPGASGLSGGIIIGGQNTGDIAEIIITNVADTLAQRQQMFAYFAKKYALAVS